MSKLNYSDNNSNSQDSQQHVLSNKLSDELNLDNTSDSDSSEILICSADAQVTSKKTRSQTLTINQQNPLQHNTDGQTTVQIIVDNHEQSASCSGSKNPNKQQQIYPAYSNTSDSDEEDNKISEQNNHSYRLNEDIDKINSDNHHDKSKHRHSSGQLDAHRSNSSSKKDKRSKKSNDKVGLYSKAIHEKANDRTENDIVKLLSRISRKWTVENTKICSKTHQGYLYKISTNEEEAIIKIYIIKEKDKSEIKKLQSRAFQEKIALKKIKGMKNVPWFIDSNIPDTMQEISTQKEPLWTIINFSHGCTLMKLIENWTKNDIDVLPIESIRFCQELLKTVKSIHEKGIIHRDIKPTNIIIKCNKHQENRICSECDATLIDYGLAYIRTEINDPSSEKYRSSQAEDFTVTALQEDIGHSWCRVPQMAKASDAAIRQMTDLEKYEKKQLRRSPTTDASSVCAILFTLLTKEHPGSTRTEKGVQPHHRCAKKLETLIKNSLSNTDLQVRVNAYLMDTFDKGFGFPDIQWTVEQLEYRLDIILQMMQNTSEENIIVNDQTTINETSNEHMIEELKSTGILVRKPDFIKVAQAFSRAKNIFIKQSSIFGRLQWSSNTCQWTDNINLLHEKKHFDILTCFNPDFKWSMFVIFQCYIDDCADVIKLSVGTIIDDVTILLPVARFNETVQTQMIDKRFCVELNELIQLSHKNSILSDVRNS